MKCVERDIMLMGMRKRQRLSIGGTSAKRYLLLERQMFRWIQVSLEEAEKLQALGKVAKGSGYTYMDERTGNTMVEYHVDTCKEFMDKMNKEAKMKKEGGPKEDCSMDCKKDDASKKDEAAKKEDCCKDKETKKVETNN